jgi:hypothetical protein
MLAVIVGIVLLGLGAVLATLRRRGERQLVDIAAMKTSTARDVTELCQEVAKDLGAAGRFRQRAELKGVIRCDRPLQAELSEQPCVYYEMTVQERFEETYDETDAQGHQQRRTRTGTTPVAHNSQRVPFQIEDGTGRIAVNPNGAKVEGVQVLSRYVPSTAGLRFSFGGFSLEGSPRYADRQVLGYQLTETILPLDRDVFLIGEATDSSGRLTVQSPVDRGSPFIVTLKTEEELLRARQASLRQLRVGAIVSCLAGAAAIVYGVCR